MTPMLSVFIGLPDFSSEKRRVDYLLAVGVVFSNLVLRVLPNSLIFKA